MYINTFHNPSAVTGGKEVLRPANIPPGLMCMRFVLSKHRMGQESLKTGPDYKTARELREDPLGYPGNHHLSLFVQIELVLDSTCKRYNLVLFFLSDLPHLTLYSQGPSMFSQMGEYLSCGWIIFSPVYIPPPLFYPLILNGHLGHFNILATVNNAAVNMGVQIRYLNLVFMSFGYLPESNCWIIW